MDSDVVIWKILACTVIILINSLGSFLPVYYTEWFYLKNGINRFNCFFGGILFSSAISQMLAESENDPEIGKIGPTDSYPFAHFLALIGFFFTMAMQWLIEGIKRQKHNREAMVGLIQNDTVQYSDQEIDLDGGYRNTKEKKQPGMLALFIIFGFESILTGTAIGIQRKSSVVIILALSTAATDWIQSVLFSMAIITEYGASGDKPKDKSKILYYSVLYCVVNAALTVSWIIAFSVAPWTEGIKDYSSVIMALLSGCFAYIACVDIIASEIHDSKIFGGYPSFRELMFKLGQFFVGMMIVNMIVFLESL
jgi:vacuolar-type H+-ATPase subunit I/STV1